MVTNATSLGRNGLYDWLIQRASAVVLGVYFFAVLGFFLCGGEATYASWHAYMTSTYMKVFTMIALVSFMGHAWVGLWTVSTDYLTSLQLGKAATTVRMIFQGGLAFILLAYLFWGVQILWGVK